jgi:hypothetical protein
MIKLNPIIEQRQTLNKAQSRNEIYKAEQKLDNEMHTTT